MSENIFASFFGAVEDGAREREAREYGRDGPHGRWDPGEMPWTIPRRIHPEYRERLSTNREYPSGFSGNRCSCVCSGMSGASCGSAATCGFVRFIVRIPSLLKVIRPDRTRESRFLFAVSLTIVC